MKKRLKAKLIALLIGLMALFTLSGCQLGVTVDQIMSNNDLQAQVTYYANGGKFDGGKNVKDMYYKEQSPIFNIKVNSTTLNGTATVERSNHELLGWYMVELNDDGTPKFADEEKLIPVLSDTPVDFSKRIQKGDHWYVGAKWQANVQVVVKLVCDDGVEIKMEGGDKLYKNGDEVASYPYTSGKVKDLPKTKDALGKQVFVGYYSDLECENPIGFDVDMEEGQQEDKIIFARYIDNAWTVIRDAATFVEMWEAPEEGKKFWLANDVSVSGVTLAPLKSFACELQGNGYTVRDLSVTATEAIGGKTTVSTLGNITKDAVIKNITFENVTASYRLANNAGINTKIYFVCSSVAEGADVENVVFSGEKSKLTVNNSAVTFYNINSAACLFGGFTNDAEYTAKYEDGFKVTVDTKNLINITKI